MLSLLSDAPSSHRRSRGFPRWADSIQNAPGRHRRATITSADSSGRAEVVVSIKLTANSVIFRKSRHVLLLWPGWKSLAARSAPACTAFRDSFVVPPGITAMRSAPDQVTHCSAAGRRQVNTRRPRSVMGADYPRASTA